MERPAAWCAAKVRHDALRFMDDPHRTRVARGSGRIELRRGSPLPPPSTSSSQKGSIVFSMVGGARAPPDPPLNPLLDRDQIPRPGLRLRLAVKPPVYLLLFGAAVILIYRIPHGIRRTNPEHILFLYACYVTGLLMIYLPTTHVRRVNANALDMLLQISKQAAAKLLRKVTDPVRKGKGLVVETLTRSVMKARSILHVGRNLFPLRGRRRRSMASYETKVLDFVERQTVVPSLLGISGMRGVGKTTLLRFVRDSYAHGSSFSYVFFLGAGPGCTVGSLHHAISVNIQQTPDVPISTCLKGKPFLLLLDDVRERLDLAAVGLPTPLGRRQKVIFTTRNHQICADMGCSSSTTIQMECLSEDDAWNLFKDKVGEQNIDAHPHIKHLAKKMVAECRGLPSALCALGRAMSTKSDVKEWRYGYDMLKRKRSPVSEIQEIDDEGHSDLYHLEEKLQDLFF